jgi:hypothetical protein
MDAVGELPEIPKHLAGLVLQIGQLSSGELVTAESVAGEPQPRDERYDLLLNPVMQVSLDTTTLGILGGNKADPRGGQLLEALLELRREPNVGNRRSGLRGHGGQEFEIIGGIATGLGTKVNSSDLLARVNQIDASGAVASHFAGDADRLVEPASVHVKKPDLHPARTDSIANRVRESRQQLVEFGRLLHGRT